MKLILSLLVLISSFAFAGGVSGGGSDHLPDDYGAAWFLEGETPRTIKVCFKQDTEKFPMDLSQVISTFKHAMNVWSQYFADKGINDVEQWGEPEEDDTDPRFFQIVTQYEILSQCGSEDLTIYLGYSTKEVEEIRSKLFDPYALAHKVSYDNKNGWGKGFIWLKGKTNDEGRKDSFIWDKNALLNLKGVLTHELGHIFGNDHRDGTIMSPSFANQMYDWEIEDEGGILWNFYKFYMTDVDWNDELVQCINCKLVHEGGQLWHPGSRSEKTTFKFLTGAEIQGTATAKVQINDKNVEQLTGTYTVSDSKRTVTYPITFKTYSVNYTYGEDGVFKRTLTKVREEDDFSWETADTRSSDFTVLSLMGWMEMNGKIVPLVLEGKTSPIEGNEKYPEDTIPYAIVERSYPYRLIALDGKERYVLFTKLKVTVTDSDGDGDGSKARRSLHKRWSK